MGADAGGKEASAVFTLTVGEFNDVPVASALQDHLLTDALVEDTDSTYKFDAFDGRGDLSAYVFVHGCAGSADGGD